MLAIIGFALGYSYRFMAYASELREYGEKPTEEEIKKYNFIMQMCAGGTITAFLISFYS